MFAFRGTTPPKRLRLRIARGEAAGVILFGDNVRSIAQVRRMTRSLQAIHRPAGLRAPLLVMVDQEGGLVKRLPGAPDRSPPQMSATGRPSVARSEGRATARTLTTAGVNVDLAPVLDVARPGSNIESDGRSFGRDAATVIRYGDAFVRGLRAGGIAATAKHFPGFGRARFNTDDRPVYIRASASTLRRVDERPFASVPTDLVMVSSAIYPALDSQPALLSRKVIGGELRGRVGFNGVTAADNLDGGALAAQPDVAIRAAAAGDDLLLYLHYQSAAHAVETLAKALRSGRLGSAAARMSMARILALRGGLHR